MNIVFSIRVIITSMIVLICVVIPRILIYFGLNFDMLTAMTSPWATFLFILIAGVIFLWSLIKNVKLTVILLILLLLVAFGLTFYFCDLALPF